MFLGSAVLWLVGVVAPVLAGVVASSGAAVAAVVSGPSDDLLPLPLFEASQISAAAASTPTIAAAVGAIQRRSFAGWPLAAPRGTFGTPPAEARTGGRG